MLRRRSFGAAVALAAALGGASARAQDGLPSAALYLPDSASPFGKANGDAGDPGAVAMPALSFASDGTEAADFDKYYTFQRAGTDYPTAFADIVECDSYARGLQSGIAYQQPPYQYAGTLAGGLGGMVGNLMVQAIFGSAEKRRLRRVNMRTCMHFKGYDRIGLAKDVWSKFNFEEGLSSVDADKRRMFLKQQALVASSGKLQGKVLGL